MSKPGIIYCDGEAYIPLSLIEFYEVEIDFITHQVSYDVCFKSQIDSLLIRDSLNRKMQASSYLNDDVPY